METLQMTKEQVRATYDALQTRLVGLNADMCRTMDGTGQYDHLDWLYHEITMVKQSLRLFMNYDFATYELVTELLTS